MKKILLLSFFVLLSVLIFSFLKAGNKKDNYNFKIIMEKEFLMNSNSFFKPNFKVGGISIGNNYFINNLLPSPGRGKEVGAASIPNLVYVDKNINLYLVDIEQGIKIFDKYGSLNYNYDFEDGFRFSGRVSIDQSDNVIFELTNNNLLKYFKTNITDFGNSSLSIATTSEDLTSNRIYNSGIRAMKDSIAICFYDIKNNISEVNGKLISPQNIFLFKTKTLKSYTSQIPGEYYDRFLKEEELILSIEIENYSDKKYIYIQDYFIDQNKNLYLSGIHSDEIVKESAYEIKVMNPTFFIWKFEKQ